ncbi:MAG TPA: peptidylprolyl isomerase [Acetobacteraceae bacterium]|nr:peptidylprolyl isomerase [Acetobacteraceae bacterium]
MRTAIHHAATSHIVAVNDAVIANADIAREVQNHTGASPQAAWHEATRALVIRQLLLQRAQALDLVATPRSEAGSRETEEEALIRTLLDTEVRIPTASEAECRRYHQANPGKFRSPELFEPQHILFKAPRDDTAAFARAMQRASQMLAVVQAAPEEFATLARRFSDCPSAAEGGRLGQIARGDSTPEFEAALLSLAPGETCAEPVQTRYGVHVVRLERKVEGAPLPFELVGERIAAYLEENAWRRAVTQYVSLLAGEARITGFDLPGAASPLVQ